MILADNVGVVAVEGVSFSWVLEPALVVITTGSTTIVSPFVRFLSLSGDSAQKLLGIGMTPFPALLVVVLEIVDDMMVLYGWMDG